jgi:hypothetical protein
MVGVLEVIERQLSSSNFETLSANIQYKSSSTTFCKANNTLNFK